MGCKSYSAGNCGCGCGGGDAGAKSKYSPINAPYIKELTASISGTVTDKEFVSDLPDGKFFALGRRSQIPWLYVLDDSERFHLIDPRTPLVLPIKYPKLYLPVYASSPTTGSIIPQGTFRAGVDVYKEVPNSFAVGRPDLVDTQVVTTADNTTEVEGSDVYVMGRRHAVLTMAFTGSDTVNIKWTKEKVMGSTVVYSTDILTQSAVSANSFSQTEDAKPMTLYTPKIQRDTGTGTKTGYFTLVATDY